MSDVLDDVLVAIRLQKEIIEHQSNEIELYKQIVEELEVDGDEWKYA